MISDCADITIMCMSYDKHAHKTPEITVWRVARVQLFDEVRSML